MAGSTFASLLARLGGAAEPVPPAPISTRTLIPQRPPAAGPPTSLSELQAPRQVGAPALRLSPERVWRMEGRAGMDGAPIRVSVEWASPDPRTGDATRRTIRLADLGPSDRGQAIAVDVARPGPEGGWVWCGAGPDDSVATGQDGRCRLIFSTAGRDDQYFYFVMASDAAANATVLVGEERFGYKDWWEAEAPLTVRPRWRGR